MSKDKEGQNKSSKKKELTCFRCKKVGHYASECNEELPSMTPKNGSSMLIMDKESSTEQEEDTEENTGDKDGQCNENQEIEDFIKYVEGNMISNCNITRQDILRAEDIFRPNLGSLKGKTTRHPTQHINIAWTIILEEILEKYGEVTLAIDKMVINKTPFMIMMSRNIHFGTAELICDKAKKTLMTSIQQVVRGIMPEDTECAIY